MDPRRHFELGKHFEDADVGMVDHFGYFGDDLADLGSMALADDFDGDAAAYDDFAVHYLVAAKIYPRLLVIDDTAAGGFDAC